LNNYSLLYELYSVYTRKKESNKYFMSIKIKAVIAALVLIFGVQTAIAQDFSFQPQAYDAKPVTDAEIKNLVKINLEIQPLQMKLQEDMIEYVEKSGMEVPRFAQIMNAVQQGQDVDALNVSEKEMETFTDCLDTITKMQDEADDKILQIIEENGFEIERFQEVFMALQTDPEIQERFIAEMTKMEEQ
jgi:predicted house-cleaning noncanonical NTP pyrophosphatase (MazG superfamily)